MSREIPREVDAVVVGAGLAGLTAARHLLHRGLDVLVVESGSAVGGRVRTDQVDGFLLDRGFQVMLTAYEELNRQVDMERLDLREFDPGSIVWTGRALETLGDPFRKPGTALPSLLARSGTLGDKARVALLRQKLLAKPPEHAFQGEERTTLQELESLGFSHRFIESFFRPFLGGVFLERGLETSASLFRYYFRCFAQGAAAIPARGMQRLPEALAKDLEGRISFEAPATSVSPTGVTLQGGHEVLARHVVVAVDGPAQAQLLDTPPVTFKATVTSYFASDTPPVRQRLLILDGEGTGPANHVAVVSNVAPDLAPAGMHLVSVSGVDSAAADPDGFPEASRRQLARWFGDTVNRWDHLKTYHIPHALPKHPPGSLSGRDASPRRPDGIVVAGDHLQFGSLQGALLSGRRAAQAVLHAHDPSTHQRDST